MLRRVGPLGLTALFALAAGCADRIEYVQIVAPPRALAARTPVEVDMFMVTPPSRPHTDLAFVQVIRGANEETMTQMLAVLRAQAAVRGCDALVVTMIDARSTKYSPLSVEGSCEIYTSAASGPQGVPSTGAAHEWTGVHGRE